MPITVDTSELQLIAPTLRAGDKVLLSGTVYTGRDAAHKRFKQLIEENKPLPFPLENSTVYYAGPTGTKEGMVIGSCGPTTSGRMDPYAPQLLDLGMKGMIGKGERSPKVVEAIIKNKAVYFCAIGGAGALACKCIESCEVIAFEDLGCESVKKLYIKDFPLTVAIDCSGGNLFESGRHRYQHIENQ
ncbi:MAG: Fe-S-containing hydro-lyase [Firmicutes bacterium]|nr:Fe-S-containing hydro-lyase [Bacillota bacterium]